MPRGANQVLADLTVEAESFVRQGTDLPVTVERQVSMRYKGQGWEIPVRLGSGPFDGFAAELLSSEFSKAYEEFFGRAINDLTIEAVSWSVRVASIQQRPPAIPLLQAQSVVVSEVSRPMFDPVLGSLTDAAIVERDSLSPGSAISGPAIVVESQTTTVLGSHHVAVMQTDGTLLITRNNETDARINGGHS